MRCLFGPTQYIYLVPTIVLYSIHLLYIHTVSESNKNRESNVFFYALKYTAATAKTTWILWSVAVKAMWAPRAALFVVLRRLVEQVLYMVKLRGSCGKQLLLLSLN